ncbi:hypothetical protein QF028_002460 [Neobacillus sp. B4I6]|uniref:hypothetical protein n=1 Tax=Neobacillus sp. B4I6 TaxID=3373925 RepID=UPI003D197786
MKLILLEPEVAGEIGEKTIFSTNTYTNGMKEISYLNYEFQGWLGDELLESTPCFIVTENLANSIQSSELNGYLFNEVEVTVSDLFKELYPNEILPNFKRLIPIGKVFVENHKYSGWSQEDFCLSQNLELVVSTNAFEVTNNHKLNYCDVFELNKD